MVFGFTQKIQILKSVGNRFIDLKRRKTPRIVLFGCYIFFTLQSQNFFPLKTHITFWNKVQKRVFHLLRHKSAFLSQFENFYVLADPILYRFTQSVCASRKSKNNDIHVPCRKTRQLIKIEEFFSKWDLAMSSVNLVSSRRLNECQLI